MIFDRRPRGLAESSDDVQAYIRELRAALSGTAHELAGLRAGCCALDALLSEFGFAPTEGESERRFGFDAAKRVTLMRAHLQRSIEHLEASLNEDSRCWVQLGQAIHGEPEYKIRANTGVVPIHEVAIEVIERLKRERAR